MGRRTETHEAFQAFVDGCAPRLLRTAFLLTGEVRDAEDLVQECLVRLARQYPRVRSMEHPAAYARRVLVNASLDDAPRRSRQRSELVAAEHGLDAQPDDASARSFGVVDLRSELIDALRGLAPRQRTTIVLRYFEELSETDVAELLGCSVGTVKSTTSRALDRLRKKISRDEDHDDPGGLEAVGVETERSTA